MICPVCGNHELERDEVDVGVGDLPVGPWGCPVCHWVEDGDPGPVVLGVAASASCECGTWRSFLVGAEGQLWIVERLEGEHAAALRHYRDGTGFTDQKAAAAAWAALKGD